MKKALLLIIGIVILLVAIFLDYFGFNTKPGYGIIQIIGMVVGGALIIFGLVMKSKKAPIEE